MDSDNVPSSHGASKHGVVHAAFAVTDAFARQKAGAKEVRCSALADAVIKAMDALSPRLPAIGGKTAILRICLLDKQLNVSSSMSG